MINEILALLLGQLGQLFKNISHQNIFQFFFSRDPHKYQNPTPATNSEKEDS